MGNRLIGEDGGLYTVALGTEIEGDGTSTFATLGGSAGWHQVTAQADSGSQSAEVNIGDLFYVAADTLVLADDESIQPVRFAEISQVVSWSFGISRPEIDLTTLADTTRVFRFGRDEWSGEMTGIVEIEYRELLKRFVRQVNISASGTHTVVPRDQTPITFVGAIQKQERPGATHQFLYLPVVELGGWTFGATDGSRQEFTGPMRLGEDVLSRDPTLYSRKIA